MSKPLVCFITWNRAGLTARSLRALLDSTDDFELFIVDNHSRDNTWEYIKSIDDPRIVEKKRFGINRGENYAINYVLSKRKKDQFFLWVENDVCINTRDWISRFLKVMDAFPDVGLLGAARETFFEEKGIIPKVISQGEVTYHQHHTVLGCCVCIRPEVFDYIGYLNEEVGLGDKDICARINEFSPFKTGYVKSIEVDQTQFIPCDSCYTREWCTVLQQSTTCFEIYNLKRHKDQEIWKRKWSHPRNNRWKEFLDEVKQGKRSAYCASIHDPESVRRHYYRKEWAEQSFEFFKKYCD